MYDLHKINEIPTIHSELNIPLDLRLYNKLNKTKKFKIKHEKFKKFYKSKSYLSKQKLKNNHPQQQHPHHPQQQQKQHPDPQPQKHHPYPQQQHLSYSSIDSNILICSICHMETMNFNIFVQHMSLHLNQSKLSNQLLNEFISIINQKIFNNNKNNKHNQLLCNICNHLLNMDQFTELMTHLQNKHIVTNYHCNGCEEIFSDQIQCLVHILYHHIITTKSVIQDNDTINSLNSSSTSSTSSTITNHDNDTTKLDSYNENDNTSCKYQHSNSSPYTNIQLPDISTKNTTVLKEQTTDLITYTNNNPSLHEYPDHSNLLIQNDCNLMNSNRDDAKLNQISNHQLLINESSSINKFDQNYTYQLQSIIHFLSMLLWPNLWSIHWKQLDIDGILNKYLKCMNEDMNMILNTKESVGPFDTPSTVSSLSSIPSLSSLHYQGTCETSELTHKIVDMVTSNSIKSKEFTLLNNENQTEFQQTSNCVLLLNSHPVLGLLPHEMASNMDSYKASKICHLCLKEFTDEMTVLHHQVEEHSLEDNSNVSTSINEQNSLLIN
ncbi:hypothetical protein Smp_171730 [Schistosoma mansoni]|uniref:hypothetical protein n=1 Tax=Schistosoma mansoni TaxID=6183 RepID=UPI00022DC37E|nr:hypothetical protein Smp_171730 [Schistosoma mansoni]|eukprot:XP_018652086.1 hypothetical protein Smp_171730 [Schistosoma mansoni]